MSYDALPCIVCGHRLQNVWPTHCDNQPADGTAFTSHGHYGSTFFDPMDGQQIEINVCDDCLRKHTDKIGWKRSRRAFACEGIQVGYEVLDRPLVPYTGTDEEEGPVDVDVEILGQALNHFVWWNTAACNEARRLAAIRDSVD